MEPKTIELLKIVCVISGVTFGIILLLTIFFQIFPVQTPEYVQDMDNKIAELDNVKQGIINNSFNASLSNIVVTSTPSPPTQFNESKININYDFIDYPLRWEHLPLTYKIVNPKQCYNIRIERIEKALNEVELRTNNTITFIEVNDSDNVDISFVCNKTGKYDYDGSTTYETLGLATITFVDTTNINVEKKWMHKSTRIDLYGGVNKDCLDYPSTELHEILHVIGVGHSDYVGSVMSKYQHYCLQKYNREIDGDMYNALTVQAKMLQAEMLQ